jgi:hypothetical protein
MNTPERDDGRLRRAAAYLSSAAVGQQQVSCRRIDVRASRAPSTVAAAAAATGQEWSLCRLRRTWRCKRALQWRKCRSPGRQPGRPSELASRGVELRRESIRPNGLGGAPEGSRHNWAESVRPARSLICGALEFGRAARAAHSTWAAVLVAAAGRDTVAAGRLAAASGAPPSRPLIQTSTGGPS